MRSCLVALLVACAGCGDDEETEMLVVDPPSDCPAGEWRNAENLCVPAGLPPDMPCAPGETLHESGACIPAGVPVDGCGEGFAHDGDRGCEPILPATPCGSGMLAVPGETQCHAVAPCAEGRWGDIPVGPDTEYVDASYPGTDSDGSALKPWSSIQSGVDAAAPGAVIAIAAGSYVEDVIVKGKPVLIWGVCPALVELSGTGAALGALYEQPGATGTEVRNIAVRGDAVGVIMSGSLDVVLERVWLHHAWRGLDIEGALGPTSAHVQSSLLEQNRDLGVFVQGADVTVQASVVRDTQPDQGLFGRGLSVQPDFTTSTSASLVLRTSLVERNHDHGVFSGGAETTIEASVIRGTRPDADDFGRGVAAEREPLTDRGSTLVVRASLIDDNRATGVFVSGSQATLENTVVRGTQPNIQGLGGRGVDAEVDIDALVPSSLQLRRSLLRHNHELGVFLAGAEATIDATVVRDTQPDSVWGGVGVAAQREPMLDAPSKLAVMHSIFERNAEAGIAAAGSELTIDATVVRDTAPGLHGRFGRGVNVQWDDEGIGSTLRLERSIVENSHESSVLILDSAATLHGCLLGETVPNPQGIFGHGVTVALGAGATITATRIHDSALAAVAAWATRVEIGGSAFSCQAFDFDAENYGGKDATLVDLGANVCGCPDPKERCKAVSAGLEPPDTLPPAG